MDTLTAEQVLVKIARKFTGREIHRLSDIEREIVEVLEESGYLSVRKPWDGFIGEIIRPKDHGL